MKDFTLHTYQLIINQLKRKNYLCKQVEHFSEQNSKKVAYLRHDVDSWPSNALQMAKIEHKNGICSTYYFRKHRLSFNEKIIKQIADMGHEIGYHYEDLVYTDGNFELAYQNFQKNLDFFRKFYPVRTITMHGRPLSKWDSRELWNKFDYKILGITCEPYLDIDYNKVLYLTDTGGCWDGDKFSIRDNVPNHFDFKIHSSFDLIGDIDKGLLPEQIILNVHPARWNDNYLKWVVRKYILTLPKRKAKQLLKTFREKQ
jgi:hypothetical protein